MGTNPAHESARATSPNVSPGRLSDRRSAMHRIVQLKGARFLITTHHSASSYGQPVAIAPDGLPLGPADIYCTPQGPITGAQILATAAPPPAEPTIH